MKQSEALLEKLDTALAGTLPENCMMRGFFGASLVADKCIDAFLVEKGWSRDCFGAMTLFTSIVVGGDWRIPQHIHDQVCGCQRSGTPKNRTQAFVPMKELIVEWQLPTRENPKMDGNVTYFAEVGGSRRHPLVTIRFFSGEIYNSKSCIGYASWSPETGVWSPNVLEKGRPYTSIPTYLPQVTKREEAIRGILEAIRRS